MAQNKLYFETAKEVAEEKGVSVEDIYESTRKSFIYGFKKKYGNTSCEVVIDPDKNELTLYAKYQIVEKINEEENEELEEDAIKKITLEEAKKMAEEKRIKSNVKVGDIVFEAIVLDDKKVKTSRRKKTSDDDNEKSNKEVLSRTDIAAAKNVFNQDVKARQREVAYEFFKEKEGEMILATITNIDDKKVTLNIGMNTVAFLPKSEFVDSDKLFINSNVSVYVKKVEQTSKEPRVQISRTDKNLVTRLMENYIPEIKNGIIEIKGIARDPGDRSKIALYSNDENVDAIGSCVGEGGSRIKEIVNALGGEKVDLYKWSENPEELIPNSLQPANVTKVLEINVKEKSSRVVVPDDQLSLAIGKSGQNVRLAVQSCGWKIDIIPTSEAFEQGLLFPESNSN
ncbi:MAG: transcription termination factor NusA [Acholeplasmatales bacterium]|nr:transcription termination factor NusA [Acholeplasmatales bacterium]